LTSGWCKGKDDRASGGTQKTRAGYNGIARFEFRDALGVPL